MEKTSYDIEQEIESFHWWFVVRRKLLKSFLSSINLPKECTLLDIGCGVGSNFRVLRQIGLNAIGLDRSIYVLSLAQKKLKFHLINADLNKLPILPQSIGLIVAMDVLEHLENDVNGIHEFYQALEKGGTLILTVPAFKFLWGIQDMVAGHKRRYSKEDISNKLTRGGFEIIRFSYFNFFLFFPIFLARRIIYILGLEIESENKINSPFINFILKTVFSIEPFLLKYFSFPFGVSILCVARKNETV